MNQAQEREETPLQQGYRKQNPLRKEVNKNTAGQIKVTFYTDPLCCWSWAFEKVWQKFVAGHEDDLSYSYVMCGMIPDWTSYRDDMNSVSKPLHMGPIWMHASEVTQVPMKYSIWHEDPPSSSYPSCIAVKTAGLQSRIAEELFLRRTREALMLEGMNISRLAVLLDIAKKMDGDNFSVDQFKSDWSAGLGKDAFRRDLQKAKLNSIGRYPTLTFQNEAGKGIMIVGYRPYDALLQAYERAKGL